MRSYLKKLFIHFLPSQSEKGQSLIIFAFSFVGLLAAMGLALDLGLIYAERVKLNRAIDAAVLAGVTELPIENAAINRAIEYLTLNGYEDNTEIYVQGCIRDTHDYYNATTYCGSKGCGEGNVHYIIDAEEPYLYRTPSVTTTEVRNTFWINTQPTQDDNFCQDKSQGFALTGNAFRLYVTGTVKVDLNFMPFLGFDDLAVQDPGVAQNAEQLDVVLVIDQSGSMDFDPICIGCWVDQKANNPNLPEYANGRPNPDYSDYPGNGMIYPYAFDFDADGDGQAEEASYLVDDREASIFENNHLTRACTWDWSSNGQTVGETAYKDEDDNLYMILEAELYSFADPKPIEAFQQRGKGYWAFQRGEMWYAIGDIITSNNSLRDPLPSSGSSIDSRGAHMAFHPVRAFMPTYSQDGNHTCDFPNNAALCPPFGKFYTADDARNAEAPVLEYNFRFHNRRLWGSQAHIWAKVHPSRSARVGYGFAHMLYTRLGPNFGGDPDTGVPFYDYAYARVKRGQNCAVDEDCADKQLRAWLNINSGPDPTLTDLDGKISPYTPAISNEFGGWDKTLPTRGWDASMFSHLPENENNKNNLTNDEGRFWRWVYLGTIDRPEIAENGTFYRLYFYAGSPGFAIDRILITNHINANDNPIVPNYPHSWRSSQSSFYQSSPFLDPIITKYADGSEIEYTYGATRTQTYTYTVRDAPPTAGSAYGEACDRCNPIYGRSITDTLSTAADPLNPAFDLGCGQTYRQEPPFSRGGSHDNGNNILFTDWASPMRPAQEAVKYFIRQLDAERDQVALVGFHGTDNEADHKTYGIMKHTQLECITRRGANCTAGSAFSHTLVLHAVEKMSLGNITNTSGGLKAGLEVLGIFTYGPGRNGAGNTTYDPITGEIMDNACDQPNDPLKYNESSSCGRAAAKKVIILLTDGNPTRNAAMSDVKDKPSLKDYNRTCLEANYPFPISDPLKQDHYDCAIWFAERAAENGVIIYTIGIGFGVDSKFIEEIARIGNGRAYRGNSEASLRGIFDDILENISVTLVE